MPTWLWVPLQVNNDLCIVGRFIRLYWSYWEICSACGDASMFQVSGVWVKQDRSRKCLNTVNAPHYCIF